MPAAALAFDRSARTVDQDGRLHVRRTHISKANVRPYYGREIPGCAELGLDADRVYKLLLDPRELEQGARTFERLPILSQHVPVTVDNPRPDLVVGAIGSDVAFAAPYLDADLCVWDSAAIAGIDTRDVVELSIAYRYVPVMEPGEFEGEAYDGRMTQIRGNHLALVEVGRAGPDVVVADAAWNENDHPRDPDGKFGTGSGSSSSKTHRLADNVHHGALNRLGSVRAVKESPDGNHEYLVRSGSGLETWKHNDIRGIPDEEDYSDEEFDEFHKARYYARVEQLEKTGLSRNDATRTATREVDNGEYKKWKVSSKEIEKHGGSTAAFDQSPTPRKVTAMRMTKLGKAIFVALCAASPVIAKDAASQALLADADRSKLDKKDLGDKLIAIDPKLDRVAFDSMVDSMTALEINPDPQTPAADGDPDEEDDEDDEPAMDAATVQRKIDEATSALRAQMLEAQTAAREVENVVGVVQGMDSAADIYGFALDEMKVDRKGVEGAAALRALFRVASRNQPAANEETVAADAQTVADVDKRFGLGRFRRA